MRAIDDMRAAIRPAKTSDLDELAAMGAELAHLHYGFDPLRFMYGEGFAQGYRWWFRRELRNKRACFFVVDGAAEGLAGYVYGRLEGKDWNELLDEHAALVDLFVRPSERRHGVGAELVRAFCRWSDERGAPRMVLSTATQNTAAQALFERLGFRRTMVEMTRERGGG